MSGSLTCGDGENVPGACAPAILRIWQEAHGLIKKFSAEGEFMSQFRVNDHDKNCTTFNLALDLNKGLIICTEISLQNNTTVEGNTVLLFSLEGELQKTFELSDMSCLLDIAVTSCGNLVMSDIIGSPCVLKADQEGNFLSRVADFTNPGDVCIDEDGTLIVPDSTDDCVHILNPDGSLRHRFGSSGNEKGQLNGPFGVATDGENILVADAGNNRVQVFKYDGTHVCIIESNEDPLRQPRGLAVTGDGHMYVVDRDNHCIKKYKYRDMP